jgi:hypothetical protein
MSKRTSYVVSPEFLLTLVSACQPAATHALPTTTLVDGSVLPPMTKNKRLS